MIYAGVCNINMCLVDDQGHLVRVLSGHKPSRSSHSKVATPEDFVAMVHTELYTASPSTKPGTFGGKIA